MHEMHIQLLKSIHVDLGREVGKLVQLSLLFPPIEAILPLVGQPFDVRERGAIVPVIRERHFVWKGCKIEFGLQRSECRVWDGDFESLD